MELVIGDVDRAFGAYSIVWEESPSSQAVFDDVWEVTAESRRFDLAERFLSLSVARFPDDAKALYYRGHVRLLERRSAAAAADFAEAIEKDSGFREARLGLAEARRRTGDRIGAASPLREILAAQPEDEAALDALRDVAEEIALAGNDAAAGDLLEIVSRARPDDRTTRVNWAVACARTGRTGESRRILAEGVARDPDDARLRNELGIAHRAALDYPSAEREYRAALETGFNFDAAENLAFLLLDSGRSDDAITLLAEIVLRDPSRIRSSIAYERATRTH